MSYHPNSSAFSDSDLQEELLEALLESEEAYPWNPLDPEVDAYFDELESQFDLVDSSDEAFNQQADDFFSTLHQHWTRFDPQPPSYLQTNIS